MAFFEVMKVERGYYLDAMMGTGCVFDGSIVRSSSIRNISNVTGMCIRNRISYGLSTAIRQKDMVLAFGSVTVSGFIVTKVQRMSISTGICYLISIVVYSRAMSGMMGCSVMDRTGMVSVDGGHKGREDNENLKWVKELHVITVFFLEMTLRIV